MDGSKMRPSTEPAPLTEEDRRDFLRRAGKFAVTAPATALLLQAAAKPAKAPSASAEETASLRRIRGGIDRLNIAYIM